MQGTVLGTWNLVAELNKAKIPVAFWQSLGTSAPSTMLPDRSQGRAEDKAGKNWLLMFSRDQNTSGAIAYVTSSHTGQPWPSVLMGQLLPSPNVY